jgi:hypothetical protein
MFQSLANGDESNFIAALGVGNRYHDTMEQTKGNVARLTVVLACVLDCDQRAVKDYGRIAKVDAVFGEIELPLLFVPREHASIVATLRRYVKCAHLASPRRAS